MLSLGDRQRGCLLGLAVGDAVGAHVRVGGVHRRGEAWAAKLGAIASGGHQGDQGSHGKTVLKDILFRLYLETLA